METGTAAVSDSFHGNRLSPWQPSLFTYTISSPLEVTSEQGAKSAHLIATDEPAVPS